MTHWYRWAGEFVIIVPITARVAQQVRRGFAAIGRIGMALYPIAGVSALLAIPALLLSGLFLALFFGGRGAQFGPLNDFFVAINLFLLVPPALAIRTAVGGQAGAWFTIVTWLAIAGMVLAGVGQLLLIAGVISLQASFVTGG